MSTETDCGRLERKVVDAACDIEAHEVTRPGGPNDPGVLWNHELVALRWALRKLVQRLLAAREKEAGGGN